MSRCPRIQKASGYTWRLLAPDIVEAILDGRQPAAMTLAALMRPFAVGWERQA